MTPRLPSRATFLVLLALVPACDDPAEPRQLVPLDALDLDVELTDSVQANDSFDIAVTVGNGDLSVATQPLVVTLGLSRDGEFPAALPVSAEVPPIPAGASSTVTVRVAIPGAVAGLGGMHDLIIGILDEENGGRISTTRELHLAPDIGAVCEPAIATLPLTANTNDHLCSIDGEALTVLAVDAVPGFDYRFESTNAIGWSIDLFDESGAELLTRGSTPDGNFFFVETAGTVYVVIDPTQQPFDFTLDAVAGQATL